MYKAIMVGYDDNYTRYTYKLYNPETKMVIMSRDIKWAEWKTKNPEETIKMFHNSNEDDIVPVIEEEKTTKPEPEDKLPVHVISDERESVRTNEIIKSSELTYPKKYTDTDTSAHGSLINALKN